MASETGHIGFSSQRLRLADMEYTGRLVAAGLAEQEIKDELLTHLADRLAIGKGSNRGSTQKLTTLLMNIWVKTPLERAAFMRDGKRLFQRLNVQQRVAVHWGLVIAAYPFWSAVAEVAGRLLNLQQSVTADQVYRRLRENYGDRELVYRATRTVLRSFFDWGVIKELPGKGVYEANPSHVNLDAQTSVWLVEAYLRSRTDGRSSSQAIIDSPALFPFVLGGRPTEHSSDRIDVAQHGVDQDVVMLRG